MRWQPFEALASYWLALIGVGGMCLVAILTADGEIGWVGLAVLLMASRAIKILGWRAEQFERLHAQQRDGTDADTP